MEPWYQRPGVTLYHGDSLRVLAELPDASVDACVTDPPYEIGFMSTKTRKWDETGIAHSVDLWREVLRVLKPGAHLLAMGSTRTYHRMTCAIEDAGFEIRDCIGLASPAPAAWCYGSGFPKSLDIGKAIDGRREQNTWFGPWLRSERKRRGFAQKDLAAHFPSVTGGLTGCVANWELGFNLPTPAQFEVLRSILGFEFPSLEAAEREVLATRTNSVMRSNVAILNPKAKDYDITAPATDAAKQWDGWHTALKPSWEPIVTARKPLAKGLGVAANVLRYGTGGLNVDAARIGTTVETWPATRSYAPGQRQPGHSGETQSTGDVPPGRWPANLILSCCGFDPHADGCPVAELDRQSGVSKSTDQARHNTVMGYGGAAQDFKTAGFADAGGASRYFFVAQPTLEEREEYMLRGETSTIEAWEKTTESSKPVSDVEQSSLQAGSELHVNGGSAPKPARTQSTDTESRTRYPRTRDTLNESSKSAKSDTPLIPSSERRFSLESTRQSMEDHGNHANNAGIPSLTDTTTTTTSRSSSSGSVESAISADTLKSAELGEPGSVESRFLYVPKPSRAERDRYLDDLPRRTAADTVNRSEGSAGMDSPRAGAGRTSGARNHHPTTKPVDLMRHLTRLVCRPGGTVIDPFTGSGTTGVACRLEGFNFIGIDQDSEYLDIAVRRMAKEALPLG